MFSFGTPVHKEKEKDKEQEKEKEKDKEKERAKRKKGSSKSAKRYSNSSESDRRKKLLILHVKDDSSSPIDFFGLAKGLKQQEVLLEKQEQELQLQLQSPQPHFGVMWQDLEVANQERDDPIEAGEESSGASDCLTPKTASGGTLRVTSGGVRRKHTRCRSLGGSLSRHKGKTVGILVSPHKQPPKSATELQFTK